MRNGIAGAMLVLSMLTLVILIEPAMGELEFSQDPVNPGDITAVGIAASSQPEVASVESIEVVGSDGTLCRSFFVSGDKHTFAVIPNDFAEIGNSIVGPCPPLMQGLYDVVFNVILLDGSGGTMEGTLNATFFVLPESYVGPIALIGSSLAVFGAYIWLRKPNKRI